MDARDPRGGGSAAAAISDHDDEAALDRSQAESDDAAGYSTDTPRNAAGDSDGAAARGPAGEGLSSGAVLGYDGDERTFEGDGRHSLKEQSSSD
jgi:hypothetical protein